MRGNLKYKNEFIILILRSNFKLKNMVMNQDEMG